MCGPAPSVNHRWRGSQAIGAGCPFVAVTTDQRAEEQLRIWIRFVTTRYMPAAMISTPPSDNFAGVFCARGEPQPYMGADRAGPHIRERAPPGRKSPCTGVRAEPLQAVPLSAKVVR